MEDPEELPLKQVIKQAVEICTDLDLLDLVYKLLIYNTAEE